VDQPCVVPDAEGAQVVKLRPGSSHRPDGDPGLAQSAEEINREGVDLGQDEHLLARLGLGRLDKQAEREGRGGLNGREPSDASALKAR
jgi:hypothetical protein